MPKCPQYPPDMVVLYGVGMPSIQEPRPPSPLYVPQSNETQLMLENARLRLELTEAQNEVSRLKRRVNRLLKKLRGLL